MVRFDRESLRRFRPGLTEHRERSAPFKILRGLANVMTSKTIFSVGRSAGVFKFIEFKKLLEAEVGYTTNEPAQLCVLSAIESAVGHLLAQGIERRLWQVAGYAGEGKATVDKYLSQNQQP